MANMTMPSVGDNSEPLSEEESTAPRVAATPSPNLLAFAMHVQARWPSAEKAWATLNSTHDAKVTQSEWRSNTKMHRYSGDTVGVFEELCNGNGTLGYSEFLRLFTLGSEPKVVPFNAKRQDVRLGARRGSYGAEKVVALQGPKGELQDLSLDSLKTYIVGVYHSKAEHDARCKLLGEPTETMDQHLRIFIQRRYCSRPAQGSLVDRPGVDAYECRLRRAVTRWRHADCDVEVFGKILANLLSENFPAIQNGLRASAEKRMLKYVLVRHASLPQASVDAIWRERQRLGVPLSECQRAAKCIFSAEDRDKVCNLIIAAATKPPPPQGDHNKELIRENLVRYRAFMQILLRWQLELTERSTKAFVMIFKVFDAAEEGSLSHASLLEFANRLAYGDPVTRSLSGAFEAMGETLARTNEALHGYRRATFSECLDIFADILALLRANRSRWRWERVNGRLNGLQARIESRRSSQRETILLGHQLAERFARSGANIGTEMPVQARQPHPVRSLAGEDLLRWVLNEVSSEEEEPAAEETTSLADTCWKRFSLHVLERYEDGIKAAAWQTLLNGLKDPAVMRSRDTDNSYHSL